MSIFDQLRAEFPRNAVSWRAQSMKQDGTAALALAYIDARDVMNRLDEVCGAGGWQDRYEVHGPKTICYLSVRIDGEWVTKADGAGDTDVEAEKGSISDAFKRAAVKWGIGRYLYDLDAPWVECESYERSGKRYWKSWKQDPWSKVKNSPSVPMTGRNVPVAGARTNAAGTPLSALGEEYRQEMEKCATKNALGIWMSDNTEPMKLRLGEKEASAIRTLAAARYPNLPAGDAEAAE